MSESYDDKLAAWLKGRFAPPPEPPLSPRAPSSIEMVPMRDGTYLYTEIYLPKTTGAAPVVFHRAPYPFSRPSRHDTWPLDRYLEAGYAFVFQMTRGQYLSGGVFHWHQTDREDGYDSIGWIAAQDWCDGNVGMEGSSYSGKVQLQAAHAEPEALKCIMPTAFIGDFTQCYPFIGGVPARGLWLQLHHLLDAESAGDLDLVYGDMAAMKHPLWGPALTGRPMIEAAREVLSSDKCTSWVETMSHPVNDAFWAPAHSTDEELSGLDLPIFFTDGWYDMTVGPVDFFSRLERVRPDREDRYLLVGPWNHFQTNMSALHGASIGARTVAGDSAVDLMDLRIRFFDRHLKGDTSIVVQDDRVRFYVTGLEEWKTYPTFPPPGVGERRLFLRSDGDATAFPEGGALSWEAPGSEAPDCYLYDPNVPTPSPPGSLHEPVQDCRELEIRSDVLTYTSAPLETPLMLIGEIGLVLYMASDAPDTDLFALLTEVFPDGRSIPFHRKTAGLRLRYRRGDGSETLLTPGEPALITLSLGPAGHRLAAGARLRLSLSSAYYPECDLNTNTGAPVLTDTEVQPARQTVFHDEGRPSHLSLPILEEA